MATSTELAADERGADDPDPVVRVDPRAPRFGQTLTTLGLAAAVVLQFPPLVYAVSAVLLAAVLTGWRVDVYAVLWRTAIAPLVAPPAEREAASPHRFARLLGAIGCTVATVALLAGVPLVGYAVAGVVALLAGLAAATGICVGCRMYRQVRFVRDLGVV